MSRKILVAAMAAVLLSGCAGNLKTDTAATPKLLKSGSYHGISNVDEFGGYGVVTLDIADNRIVSGDYMTFTADGAPKGEAYGMKDGKIADQAMYDKAQQSIACRQDLVNKLIETQDLSKVDAYSGATHTHQQFVEAVGKIFQDAEVTR